mmetsp:Transcript_7092/g.10832  ORF Transcript_7092/g.10832 Transcript_7092/m.10832 type:complete len:82 (+) Transcript_7092:66-311(+)
MIFMGVAPSFLDSVHKHDYSHGFSQQVQRIYSPPGSQTWILGLGELKNVDFCIVVLLEENWQKNVCWIRVLSGKERPEWIG